MFFFFYRDRESLYLDYKYLIYTINNNNNIYIIQKFVLFSVHKYEVVGILQNYH